MHTHLQMRRKDRVARREREEKKRGDKGGIQRGHNQETPAECMESGLVVGRENTELVRKIDRSGHEGVLRSREQDNKGKSGSLGA